MIKKVIYVMLILISIPYLTYSCSNDDGENKNQPPASFNLITSGTVTVTPNLIWTASTGPDGDQVFYDVYLSELDSNLILLVNDLSSVNYQISGNQTLEVNENYQWQVIAKDNNGGETSSELGGFMTLN